MQLRRPAAPPFAYGSCLRCAGGSSLNPELQLLCFYYTTNVTNIQSVAAKFCKTNRRTAEHLSAARRQNTRSFYLKYLTPFSNSG